MPAAVRRVRSLWLCALLIAVLVPVTATAGPPTFTADCGFFGPAVNPVPRPCTGAINVSVRTSIYFETAQDTAAPNPDVNPNTLTATLQAQGGPVVPMLTANQQFAAGFTGTIIGPGFLENPRHWGVHIVPSTALIGNRVYTVTLNGQATDGTPMAPRVWNFTTRRALGTETAQFSVDLTSPTVTWQGFWYSGIGKPSFDTSELYDQEPLYEQIDQARSLAPDLFVHQRVRTPLESHNNPFSDGAGNIVREQETRQVTAITTGGGTTTLTITSMAEGGLYNIDPDRQANSRLYLEEDFIGPGPGVQVHVCDRTQCQQATVQSVNESLGTVTISALTGSWTVQPPEYSTNDPPEIPDHFPYAYTTLRRLSPAGNPIYYWTRLDHEFDEHVIIHNRRPHVRVYGTALDLCRRSTLVGDGLGGLCADGPKDWHEWDAVVKEMVLHLIDRYTNPSINPNANPSIPGDPVVGWYFEIPNEPDLPIYWTGTVNELLEYYDYTVNAVLRAFDQRGIPTSAVKVGGVEIGLVDVTHPKSETPFLYHASPTAVAPMAMGLHEGNYVCENPSFNAKRASRINTLCSGPPGNAGVPLAYLSVHSYKMSADAATRLIAARDNALAIDAAYFGNMPVNSHETVPDWVVHKDPDSKDMYRWGGYFSTWATDYFRRLLARAVIGTTVDARYANGETVMQTWPPHNNFSDGRTSVSSNLYVDDNDDGMLDRIVSVVNPFFRVAELMARMPRTVAPFPTAIADGGVDIAGFRAVGSDTDWLVVYAHDRLDTGSREPGLWNVTLNLSNARFPVVKVTEYRFDRTHPAKAALDQLGIIGGNQMYGSSKAAQVDALAAADDLVPVGSPVYLVAGTGGTLQLTKPVYAQGVVVLELSGKCGNGTLDADEQCDDHNNTNGDCCSATCSIEPDGSPCGDFNGCTGTMSQPDHCGGGVCQPGVCQVGAACTTGPCGGAGTCQVNGMGLCSCQP